MNKFITVIFIMLFVSGAAYSETETLLIYREEITNNEPRLSILARVENDEIVKYILSNELFNGPYFVIEISERDFLNFKEALNKFLEWESIAAENNLAGFTREIPVTVTSNNVTWSWVNTMIFTNQNSMTINFLFDWNPSRRAAYRALLNISSNTAHAAHAAAHDVLAYNTLAAVQPLETEQQSFTLRKNYMNNEEVSLFLENITDEKISLIMEQYCERDAETERQRTLIDELFR